MERAFGEMAAFWDTYLSRLQVETPDANMNSLLNIHNPRQCHTTKNWSRYLSLYQPGLGARGIGFRDSSQDVLGILVSMPEEGKELIKKLAKHFNVSSSQVKIVSGLKSRRKMVEIVIE